MKFKTSFVIFLIEIKISKQNIGFSWNIFTIEKGFRFLRTVGQGKAPLISDFCHLSRTETWSTKFYNFLNRKRWSWIFSVQFKVFTVANWKVFIPDIGENVFWWIIRPNFFCRMLFEYLKSNFIGYYSHKSNQLLK